MHEEIIKKIKTLKKIQPRAEWKTSNRDFLLSQIKNEAAGTTVKWYDYFFAFNSLIKQTAFQPVVAMLLLVGFSVGSSLIANASFYSLPGENLYPVKIALEKAQIAISPNDERKVELKIEFAKKRINEFSKIASQPENASEEKKTRLVAVVKELQKNVASVQAHITKEMDKEKTNADHEQSLRIAVTISAETKELAESLDQKTKEISVADPELQEIVDQTVESVQAITLSAEQLVAEEQQSESATSTDPVIETPREGDADDGSVLGEEVNEASEESTTQAQSSDQKSEN